MINIVPKKFLILLLLSVSALSACPNTKTGVVEKSPDITIDQNIHAVDESGEEYDSSTVYSQDSDN